VGQRLLEQGWMGEIGKDGVFIEKEQTFQGDNSWYRFRQDEDPYLLNNYKLWIGEKRPPVQVRFHISLFPLSLSVSLSVSVSSLPPLPSLLFFLKFSLALTNSLPLPPQISIELHSYMLKVSIFITASLQMILTFF